MPRNPYETPDEARLAGSRIYPGVRGCRPALRPGTLPWREVCTMIAKNPKLFKLAAGMLREISQDGPKTLAMTIMAPAVIRTMMEVPPGTSPSVERLQEIMKTAAEALQRVADAP